MAGPDEPARDHGAQSAPEQDERPRPRGSAAAAASRARRIGGRVGSAGPRPETRSETRSEARPEPVAEPATAPDDTAASALTTKPASPAAERAPEPAGTGPLAAPAPARPVGQLPGWLRWAPAAVLSLGALVMIALLVLFSHGVWWAQPSSNAVRDQVLAAAKSCVAQTNTYKYDELTQYKKSVHGCTTGKLTSQIDKTISSLLTKYAPTLKASQTAQINRGGIETVSGNQWTLLIFGQLKVVNTNYPSGRTDPFAAEVRMEKVGGRWLMSDLQTVASPVS
jgi:Mce-associated membrane protein